MALTIAYIALRFSNISMPIAFHWTVMKNDDDFWHDFSSYFWYPLSHPHKKTYGCHIKALYYTHPSFLIQIHPCIGHRRRTYAQRTHKNVCLKICLLMSDYESLVKNKHVLGALCFLVWFSCSHSFSFQILTQSLHQRMCGIEDWYTILGILCFKQQCVDC